MKLFFQKKLYKAFTLAEVLITLGIIGLVAAMTIPIVISHFQEQAYLSGFKKAYTTLSQAYLQASQENGTADKWVNDKDAYNFMKPYLNISKDCGTQKGCFPDVAYRGFSEVTDWAAPNFNNFSSHYNVRLLDGMSVSFNTNDIKVDVNGDKPPNRWAYDLFLLRLSPTTSTIKGGGIESVNWDTNNCSKNNPSMSSYPGGSCSGWILRHWNMDYLHRSVSVSEW